MKITTKSFLKFASATSLSKNGLNILRSKIEKEDTIDFEEVMKLLCKIEEMDVKNTIKIIEGLSNVRIGVPPL